MVVGSSIDKVYMVMDYADHDIKAVMEKMKVPWSQSEVKCLMWQLLSAIDYMHKRYAMLHPRSHHSTPSSPSPSAPLCILLHPPHNRWYLHRDLKTSNLLYSNDGRLCVCDFGLARKWVQYRSFIYAPTPLSLLLFSHPFASIRIHSHPFASIRIHSHPFASIRIHSHPFASIRIHSLHSYPPSIFRYGEPIRPYTPTVITLWYRPPELLLGATSYR
jgi:serine/threonine protein kinase